MKKPQMIRCIIKLIVFSGVVALICVHCLYWVVALTSDKCPGLPPDKLNEYVLRTIIKL